MTMIFIYLSAGLMLFFSNLTLNNLKISCHEGPYITELTLVLYSRPALCLPP